MYNYIKSAVGWHYFCVLFDCVSYRQILVRCGHYFGCGYASVCLCDTYISPYCWHLLFEFMFSFNLFFFVFNLCSFLYFKTTLCVCIIFFFHVYMVGCGIVISVYILHCVSFWNQLIFNFVYWIGLRRMYIFLVLFVVGVSSVLFLISIYYV